MGFFSEVIHQRSNWLLTFIKQKFNIKLLPSLPNLKVLNQKFIAEGWFECPNINLALILLDISKLEKYHFEIGNPVLTVKWTSKTHIDNVTFESVLKLEFISFFYRFIITNNSCRQFM